MAIEWTELAAKDLKKIYQFYCKTTNREVAQKIKNEILNRSKDLKLGSEIGQIEELIKHLNQEHRYLISNHCKILYLPKNENGIIYITHVFDTRQNPKKLK